MREDIYILLNEIDNHTEAFESSPIQEEEIKRWKQAVSAKIQAHSAAGSARIEKDFPAGNHTPAEEDSTAVDSARTSFPGNITQRQQPSSFFWQALSAHQSGSVFTQNHKNYCIIWLFSSASQETSVPIRPSWNNPLLKMGLPSFSTTSSGMTILCWCLTQLSWVTMPIRRSTKIILIFIHRFA